VPITIGTEDADDPTYGYIEQSGTISLQPTSGGVAIGGTTDNGRELYVNGNTEVNGNIGIGGYNSSYSLYLNGESLWDGDFYIDASIACTKTSSYFSGTLNRSGSPGSFESLPKGIIYLNLNPYIELGIKGESIGGGNQVMQMVVFADGSNDYFISNTDSASHDYEYIVQ
jgi:hypothetical protein